jgi:thiol-disulfide isomerase/thioredoxin
VTRKRHRQKPPEKKKAPAIQWGALVGAAALIGAVILLKVYRSGPGLAASQDAVEPTPPAVETAVPLQSTPVVAETAVLPAQPTPSVVETAALLPEAQFDQLLAAGESAFVFFHSNDCYQCIRMIEIVEQVYPEFSESVPLVDVNVYDKRNGSLLQRVGLRYIPTLVFIDRAGQGKTHVGVLEAEALREQLQALAGE